MNNWERMRFGLTCIPWLDCFQLKQRLHLTIIFICLLLLLLVLEGTCSSQRHPFSSCMSRKHLETAELKNTLNAEKQVRMQGQDPKMETRRKFSTSFALPLINLLGFGLLSLRLERRCVLLAIY